MNALGLALFLGLALLSPSPSPAPSSPEETLARVLQDLIRRPADMRQAIALWRLSELEGWGDDNQRQRVLEGLTNLVAQRRAPHALKRLALRLLAERARASGDEKKARDAWNRLGWIRDWWWIGPFDNEGRKGFETVYPPEQQIDLSRPEQGLLPDLIWRPLPHPPEDGLVPLHQLFHPDTDAVAYGLSGFTLSGRATVWLHAGCDDGCRIWVDGTEVVRDPGPHLHAPDQHIRALRLDKGPHRILVKVVQGQGSWGFSLGLTDPRGLPVPGLEILKDERALQAVPAAPAGQAGQLALPQETLGSWFAKRADLRLGDKLAMSEAAFALSRTGYLDGRPLKIEDWIDRAAKLPDTDPGQAVRSRLLIAAASDDSALSLRLLEEAAARTPPSPEALGRLGLFQHIHNEPELAAQAHQKALALLPGYTPSALDLAEVTYDLGQEGLALSRTRALLQEKPQSLDVLATTGNLLRRSGQTRSAREIYERMLGSDTVNPLALRALHEMAVLRGDLARGLALLDRLIQINPLRAEPWIEKGDLELANGQIEQALASFREATRICPQEPEHLVREGEALLRLDRRDEAMARWQAALALAPQNQDLQRRMEFVKPQGRAFYAPWQVDAIELAEKAPPPQVPLAATERLLDLTVVRLLPNGMTLRFRQQLIRVNEPSAAQGQDAFQLEYAPTRQQIRLIQTRIVHPDRSVEYALQVQDVSLSEPWYNIYYDVRGRQIVFPSLRPGDLVEIAYVLEDTGDQNLLGSYFGDLAPFQFEAPASRVAYVLLLPGDRKVQFHATPRARHEERPNPDDGGTIHSWEARDVPAVSVESAMPGFSESHAFLHVSTFPKWAALAAWYGRLIQEQLVPGPEVRRLAQSLTQGLESPEEKIRALYRFVADGTRYVGLEFGIHSYVPYPVSQVAQQKFGDCKDKAGLLVAMLRDVGIRAEIALLRMVRLGEIPPEPASLSVFNHAVCYVPELDLWLDATASFHDIREIPTQDQGAMALIIEERGGRLVRTPQSGAEHNRTDIVLGVQPQPDGGALVDARVSVAGNMTPSIRAQLANKVGQKDALDQLMTELFPGAQVQSTHLENLKQLELPLLAEARMQIPGFGKVNGDALEIPALGRPATYQKVFTPYQQRAQDLVLSPPWSAGWSVRSVPPAGYGIAELPGDGREGSPFGLAEIRFQREGNALRVQAALRFERDRVKADEYPAFREFLGRVDRLFAARLRFVRGGTDGQP